MAVGASGGEGLPPGRPSAIAKRRQLEDAVVYREDDASFKSRMKATITDHWLLNTVLTVVAIVVVFTYITGDPFVGLVAALLVLTVSNLPNVLWRIHDFQRWEIFSNGVNLGFDPRGEMAFVPFSEIRSIGVEKGLRGEVLVIEMGSRRMRYAYGPNKDTFDLLRRKYAAYCELQDAEVEAR